MVSVPFDSDVSGDGTADWATIGVLFVSVDLTTLGPLPRPVDNTDHVIRAGWFSLGDSFDVGLGTFDYWREPIYADFEHTLWTPNSTGDGGGALFTTVASRIRWHFADGVSAHIHVLAF
jgi:hypothetical protein